MKTVYKNIGMWVGVSVVTVAAVFGLLLAQGVQSQEKTQCESWLDGLLTNQNGIQYILSKISSIATGFNYNRTAGLLSNQAIQIPQAYDLQAVSIATKVTEQNDAYQKFAWVLKVKNSADSGRSFTAKIQWLDADGFIVDDDIAYDLIIGADEEKTICRLRPH